MENKTVKFTLLLSPSEKEKLRQMAEFSQRSEGAVLRLLLQSAARKLSGPKTPIPQQPELENEPTPAG